MRPLFTVHGGEYLVGAEIERRFRRTNVWIPSKDTGIDLLVSDRRNRKTVSIQVKFSKDFAATSKDPVLRKELRASGWWTIDYKKLLRSPADYWIFILLGFASQTSDFIIIPPRRLAAVLRSIYGRKKSYHVYFAVTKDKRCWATRDLGKKDKHLLSKGNYSNRAREFTRWLGNWKPIEKLN